MVLTHKPIYKLIGINYLIYSSIAAKITRLALKRPFQKDAHHRAVSMIQIFHVENGVKKAPFVALQPKVEDPEEQKPIAQTHRH
ncbi:hypothetical protein HUJ04_008983 [Dendroctonus ponderosae]|nr:hypothetical protein HUJ04_008983 [Dendroctonus ponderosae]KAH1008968.1 hypothetical protein HUJ05_009455 [Dendroctonus ponderosae]